MDEIVIKISKRDRKFIAVIFIISILCIYLFHSLLLLKKELEIIKNPSPNQFSLISPSISSLSVPEFLEVQKKTTISYREMREQIEKLYQDTEGHYGFYFEDLNTGSWAGVNEKENIFVPASLLKLPLMIATLKKVELGEISLDDEVIIKKEDLDNRFGELYKKGEGYSITIEELLYYLVKDSDNTAYNVLKNQVLTQEEIITAQYAMGLPSPDQTEIQKMSPKGYSNILRSLYYSSYLRRTFSEKALSIMLDTQYECAIGSPLPKNIKVAHKIGVSTQGGYYHDCAIVYYPDKPYLLCIMSANSSHEESDHIIKETSKIVYDYISKK